MLAVWFTGSHEPKKNKNEVVQGENSAEQEETPAVDASGNPVEQTSVVKKPIESTEVNIAEPSYVYLPEQKSDDENLIFEKIETTEDGKEQSKFQDVSQVENAVAIPSMYGQAGETVSAEVKLCGLVDVCALDLRVRYDPAILKYTGCDNAYAELIYNCNEEDGVVLMNLITLSKLDETVKLCDLQFEVLADSSSASPLEIEIVDMGTLDENGQIIGCEYSTIDAQVYLNDETQ